MKNESIYAEIPLMTHVNANKSMPNRSWSNNDVIVYTELRIVISVKKGGF